jgi:hypothetical protein
MIVVLGYLDNHHWLNMSEYTDLTDPSDLPYAKWPSPRLYLYDNEARSIWTVLPAFSERCLARKNW